MTRDQEISQSPSTIISPIIPLAIDNDATMEEQVSDRELTVVAPLHQQLMFAFGVSNLFKLFRPDLFTNLFRSAPTSQHSSSEFMALHAKLAESYANQAKLHQQLAAFHEKSIASPLTAVNLPVKTPSLNTLPLEIRPRVVEIGLHRVEKSSRPLSQDYARHRSSERDRYHSPERYRYRSREGFQVHNNPPPAKLQINRQSRYEGFKYYRLGSLNNKEYPTYLNVNDDIIYLPFNPEHERDRNGRLWSHCLGRDASWNGRKINRIAVPTNAIPLLADSSHDSWWIDHFKDIGVKEIILVDQEATKYTESNEPDWYCHPCLHLDLNLITLSSLDRLRKCYTAGPRNSLYDRSTGESEIISVMKYLAEVRDDIDERQQQRADRDRMIMRYRGEAEDTEQQEGEDDEDQAVPCWRREYEGKLGTIQRGVSSAGFSMFRFSQ